MGIFINSDVSVLETNILPNCDLQQAIESCPVNCIHYVEREDLAVLEYLIRPQQKQGNGVYGGGWDRPKNVFMAARTFKRQMEDKKTRATGTYSFPVLSLLETIRLTHCLTI